MENREKRANKGGAFNGIFSIGKRHLLAVLIVLQMVGAVYLACNTSAGGDPVFTFTLANSPYEFNYIDSKLDKFPSNNGWFSAKILQEQYVVEDYDRFNYGGVYWHQRLDNHPLLYYSLVHTICSLFPGTYSILYALVINLAALLLIDLILIRIAGLLFQDHRKTCAALLLLSVTSMITFYGMVRLARMYMLLALMCLWFLWICLRLILSKRHSACWWEILLCVLLGSQTHYYYYVYCALLGLGTLLYMALKRRWKEILEVIWAASLGEMISVILFPWVIWHIVFNQMDKNETLTMWTGQMLEEYLRFLNETLFNGRAVWWLIAAAAGILWMCLQKAVCSKRMAGNQAEYAVIGQGKSLGQEHSDRTRCYVWWMLFITTMLYSVVIFTLNGAVTHYATPVYLPACILMTGFILWLAGNVRQYSMRMVPSAAVLLTVILFGSISNLRDCYTNARDSYRSYLAMHQAALDYQGADCLYVAGTDDNLLQSLWFEFGDYNEFKRIYAEDYEQLQGDLSSVLEGRNTTNTVILYVPENLGLPEGAQCLAVNNGFQVAVLETGDYN